MSRRIVLGFACALLLASAAQGGSLDKVLQRENRASGVTRVPMAKVDDLTYLRRASVDLIGRIPTRQEIDEYLAWPAAERRRKLIDKLIQSERFADRWTVFFGDMLRLRSNATGGAALTAFVHQALSTDMPYDEMSRRLISTNGKANSTPEVGFILGDNADTFALASVTSQVFLGVRIGCAQCHDHPFDVWTRKDFYGMAAFFGKTRRVESNLTRVVYTTEMDRSVVLWPPEDDADDRKPMSPKFPFKLLPSSAKRPFLARFERLIAERNRKASGQDKGASVDDLLAATDDRLKDGGLKKAAGLDVKAEARRTLRKIDVKASLYRHSETRARLAELITSPRNRLFARALVNRLWRELVGRGFVEPIDDFRQDNPPSHPQTLDFLADEFVASGFNFRKLVRMIVESETYQRRHAPDGSPEADRDELESSFLATPMRRMLAESLYDSIVTAGHLFEYKYPAGVNKKTIANRVRVLVEPAKPAEEKGTVLTQVAGAGKPAMKKPAMPARGGYALEEAIELDFKSLLAKKDDVKIERMQVMSREELEAQRMMQEQMRKKRGAKYVTKIVKREIDDNPKFNTALRMAAPAPAGHFIRVFGQTSRSDLGQLREQDPSMRQALMMLNGRLTHEASRVGHLEPMNKLVGGKGKDLRMAVRLAYLEILTRAPSNSELDDGLAIVGSAKTPREGVADLRWVLLNCNEFRFLP